MNIFLIFSKVSVIFLLILLGFTLTRAKILQPEAQRSFTNLLIYAFLPAALIKAFHVPYDGLKFADGLRVSLIMAISYSIALLIAFLISKKMSSNLQRQDVLAIGMVLPNVTFMGYPVIESLLGSEYLFFIVMANIPFEILSWSVIAKIASRHGDTPSNEHFIKTLISSPPLIAITFSVLLYLSPFRIPDPFLSTIHYLANGMTPVAMIIVGMSLAKANIFNLLKNKGLYLASGFRLLIFPIALFTILKLLGFTGALLTIPTVIFAMPTAGYTNIIANRYGSDATYAAELISMCTLLSLISIPIIMSLF